MILVDTSVMLDLVRDDQEWSVWSIPAFATASQRDTTVVNAVIYAELASNYDHIERLDSALDVLSVPLVEIPRSALFLAARAFRRYRGSGGIKVNVLPDFFVGAHAAVTNSTLLTRDAKRVRHYFPTVHIVAPDIKA